ncbi:MAG: hypothetical protein WBQ75_06880 [Acetobacteraceae bacterium]
MLGGTLSLLCLLAIGLTVLTDPYYVFGTHRSVGWNWLKPTAYNQAAAGKTYLLERAHPRTLLLGNSRIEVGFDPKSQAWPAAMRPVFNAGMSGRDLSVSVGMLEDALVSRGLRQVLVGVDFLDFLQVDDAPASADPISTGMDDNRIRVRGDDLSPNLARLLARAKDALMATLTVDAVADSLTTILSQHLTAPNTMTPLGFNPLNEYRAYTETHGFHDLFSQKQAQYAARFPHYIRPDYGDPYKIRSFRYLRQIVRAVQAKDVSLVLIVYPYHARMMDLFLQDSLWNSFEDWKRALVRVVAALDPEGHVRIVDFSGYDRYTTQQPSMTGHAGADPPWYWEPGHFRPALGEQMIRRLYGNVRNGFGRDLTPDTVESGIRTVRNEAKSFSRFLHRNFPTPSATHASLHFSH